MSYNLVMKLFIWDFHGVLEKNAERVSQEITNIILKQFGYTKRLTDKEHQAIYGQKWFQYFEFLCCKCIAPKL